ncbi:hypothetical protein DB333_01635 [Levilactobacillus brevis]|nr:hypothetical protein DB333_01635 [Levilactobacillus brevis]
MDCVVTPLKTLMGFSVHLNVQFKFYNLPRIKPMANANPNNAPIQLTDTAIVRHSLLFYQLSR